MQARYFYTSALGKLFITLQDQRLYSLQYEPQPPGLFAMPLPEGEIREWLDNYFIQHNSSSIPPFIAEGTPFQQRVWLALSRIPYAGTLTYGELADAINSSPRAVGQACKRNPLPIFIPCHRVVGRQSLGGYEGAVTGPRFNCKKWLLNHEKSSQTSA